MEIKIEISFYTKPNCPLCEEAEELLEKMSDLFGFSFSKVNILENMGTYEKYKHQIPVIEFGDGRPLSGKITGKQLTQKISVFVNEHRKR